MLALFPVAVLVFLVDCAFFTAWSGQAVTIAPPRAEEPAAYVVRIVQDDGTVRTASWDAVVVKQLGLPIDPIEDAPIEIPDTRPDTKKARFSLSYEVQLGEGTDTARWTSWPTTSTRSVAIAALVFMVLVGLRNMIVAGSPIALERPAPAPGEAKRATSSGANPPGTSRTGPRRSQPGPPPPGRSKGRGRR
jgi:hypothetical protein